MELFEGLPSDSESDAAVKVVMMEKKKQPLVPVPWLMLPYPVSSSDFTTRQFFPLSSSSEANNNNNSNNKPCHFLSLPELDSKDYRGLNYAGWIFVISSGVSSRPFLFNPITRSQISLPPLPPPTFWNQCVTHYPNHNPLHLPPPKTLDYNNHKFLGPNLYMPSVHRAALSSDPYLLTNHLEVMVIQGWDCKLSFYRHGDDEWTALVYKDYKQQQQEEQQPSSRMFRGLAYCHHRFYAIEGGDHCDNLVVCDTRASPPTATPLLPLPDPRKTRTMSFLVASDQELLLVERDCSAPELAHLSSDQVFREFQVFKLVQGKKRPEWLRMDSIGERAIFVCRDDCFAISTHGVVDCRPNCIYYSDLSVVKHPVAETRAIIIEFNILENKRNMLINCSPPSPLCLWRSLWFKPSQ